MVGILLLKESAFHNQTNKNLPLLNIFLHFLTHNRNITDESEEENKKNKGSFTEVSSVHEQPKNK